MRLSKNACEGRSLANSSQRHRWLATALVDIEPRLRKVMGYRTFPNFVTVTARIEDRHATSKKEAA